MSVKVLGIAGSLRKGSYNKLALRAAMELKPADMEIESFDIAPIPLFNDDVRELQLCAPSVECRSAPGSQPNESARLVGT